MSIAFLHFFPIFFIQNPVYDQQRDSFLLTV